MNAPAKYDRNKVVSIVNSVIAKMGGASSATQDAVVHELQSLLTIIETVRQEIAGVRAHEVAGKHVPSATDELDAVIDATKHATDTIMSACEAMEKQAAGKSDPASQAIIENVTKIYEACGFQDITGQRIRKVVNVLREIEGKVSHLLEVIGHEEGQDHKGPADTRTGDAALLNGPQMQSKAISQDEIDKLLASFD
jgi:chemotaxis protein CheZ